MEVLDYIQGLITGCREGEYFGIGWGGGGSLLHQNPEDLPPPIYEMPGKA